MKKKTRGKNFEIIKQFLEGGRQVSAAQIQKQTKIKGNIYTTLNAMIKHGTVKKKGMLYSISSKGETKTITVSASKPQILPSNPYLNTLKREHDHVMQGIHQLQITANYLNLRIRELERAASQQT